MLELFPAGFEEADAGEVVSLGGFCDAARAPSLIEALRETGWQIDSADVAPGWESAWRRFHRPLVIGGLWLGPSWETPPRGVRAVRVEPGMAFGTGAHATTRLCIELLLREERCSLLDLGCGSGVLSLVAATVGFSPVTAVDHDAVAVAETRANAERNTLRLDVIQGDVTRLERSATPLLVGNLPREVLAAAISALAPQRAIISGYLAGEPPQIDRYEVVARRELEGWGAATLARV